MTSRSIHHRQLYKSRLVTIKVIKNNNNKQTNIYLAIQHKNAFSHNIQMAKIKKNDMKYHPLSNN
jgi:hypothetical protein